MTKLEEDTLIKNPAKPEANIHVLDLWKNGMLYSAVRDNNIKVAKILIKRGIDPNIVGRDGQSALRRVIEDHLPIEWIELLLNAGANINIKDVYGNGMLFIAVKTNNAKAAKILIICGIDPNIVGSDGQSALALAIEKQLSTEWIELLLNAGANSNIGCGNTVSLYTNYQGLLSYKVCF